MALYVFEGRKPKVGRSSYVHERAVVIGKVTIGEKCFIGAGAVLRGDWGEVIVGDGSNVQENAVIHAGPDSVTHSATTRTSGTEQSFTAATWRST